MQTLKDDNKTSKNEYSDLIIPRIFQAPSDLVWKAWTEPQRVMRWWGPKDFDSPSCTIDFRVGGKYLFCMRSHSGPEIWQRGIWTTGEYKEILPMKKIVFTDSFADKHGNVVPSTYYSIEDHPLELEVILTFEDVNDVNTNLILRHLGLPVQMLEMCRTGWNESFDKLALSLN